MTPAWGREACPLNASEGPGVIWPLPNAHLILSMGGGQTDYFKPQKGLKVNLILIHEQTSPWFPGAQVLPTKAQTKKISHVYSSFLS